MSKAQSLAKQGKNNPMWGKRAATWNGGRKKHQGYWMIWKPNHPLAQKNGYIAEHRLVMEKKIGRYLKRKELVHHINEKRDDNRIENLKLIFQPEHVSLHQKGRIRTLEFREKMSKIRKGIRRGKVITKNCIRCGNKFEITPGIIQANRGKFCTKECYFNGKRKFL